MVLWDGDVWIHQDIAIFSILDFAGRRRHFLGLPTLRHDSDKHLCVLRDLIGLDLNLFFPHVHFVSQPFEIKLHFM